MLPRMYKYHSVCYLLKGKKETFSKVKNPVDSPVKDQQEKLLALFLLQTVTAEPRSPGFIFLWITTFPFLLYFDTVDRKKCKSQCQFPCNVILNTSLVYS